MMGDLNALVDISPNTKSGQDHGTMILQILLARADDRISKLLIPFNTFSAVIIYIY